MTIKFTGHNTEVTESLRNFTTEKFSRLNKLAHDIKQIHVIFEVDKLRHIAEANISLPGTHINAQSESEDMYKTIDMLVDKLARQLTKHKERTSSDHS